MRSKYAVADTKPLPDIVLYTELDRWTGGDRRRESFRTTEYTNVLL